MARHDRLRRRRGPDEPRCPHRRSAAVAAGRCRRACQSRIATAPRTRSNPKTPRSPSSNSRAARWGHCKQPPPAFPAIHAAWTSPEPQAPSSSSTTASSPMDLRKPYPNLSSPDGVATDTERQRVLRRCYRFSRPPSHPRRFSARHRTRHDAPVRRPPRPQKRSPHRSNLPGSIRPRRNGPALASAVCAPSRSYVLGAEIL